ncbi:MAG: phospholipid carrier-dependent glycosyltransferase [Minisyncoccales bacterium]
MKEKYFLNILEIHKNKIVPFLFLIFFFSTFFVVNGKFYKGLKFEGMALTSDEVSHIPAGFYYLKTRKYFINAEHPPLIKDIAALPLLFFNFQLPSISENLKYENIQWDFGSKFLFFSNNNPDFIAFLSRTIVLFLNTLLVFFLFLLIKKNFHYLTSLIFLFLLLFSPNFIAHSGLVVFDVPLSLLSLLSLLSFSLFLKNFSEKKEWKKYFFLAIIFTSLALLTKFQGLFLVSSLLLGSFFYFLFSKKELFKKYLVLIFFFSLFILFFIGIFYGLHTTKMTVEGLKHQLSYSYPSQFPEIGKNILSKLLEKNIIFINGLIEYLIGVFMMISRVVGAWQATYFLGNVYGSEGAGPFYFPILFLTKETIPFLILFFLTIFLYLFEICSNFKEKIKNFLKNPFFFVFFAFIIIYLLFSIPMKLNIGIRHIFPLIFLIYFIVSKKISYLINNDLFIFKKKVSYFSLFSILFLFILLSFFSTWPYFLSYYNFLAGGTKNGYQIATDSNYDWGGQDLKRLAKWVKENNIKEIYLHIFSNTNIAFYLDNVYKPFNIRFNPLPPSGSLLAVSAFELQNINYDKNLPFSQKYLQFEKNQIARIGTTIFIFKIP